jgi:copper(I)-binding protein
VPARAIDARLNEHPSMTHSTRRRFTLQAGLALGAALIARRVRACEFYTATLRVTHPWTRATGDEPFATVGMTLDEVTQTDRLVGVETPVAAGAQLVQGGVAGEVNLLVPQGSEIVLGEQDVHLLLVDLKHPLLLGSSYPLALLFERGGTLLTRLTVDYDRPLRRFQ